MSETTVPTKKKPAVKRVAPAQQGLDARGIDWLCAEILDEKSLTKIAQDAKVSIGTLLTWIDRDPERSARAREARSSMAKIYDERAVEELRAASDPFELSKAKEIAHHWRWRAAKIAPREYGDKLALGGADDMSPIRQQMDVTHNQSPAEVYKNTLGG